MHIAYQHVPRKYFIGLELRTNNEECSQAMPAHKERFFRENILAKIPHKLNHDLLALYTDYAGDHTQPYSWILGCEVAHLHDIPEGLVGKEIPASHYAVYTTQGEFPQGLISAWQSIWTSPHVRKYTCDFEVYGPDFHPQIHPEVKIYIAVESQE